MSTTQHATTACDVDRSRRSVCESACVWLASRVCDVLCLDATSDVWQRRRADAVGALQIYAVQLTGAPPTPHSFADSALVVSVSRRILSYLISPSAARIIMIENGVDSASEAAWQRCATLCIFHYPVIGGAERELRIADVLRCAMCTVRVCWRRSHSASQHESISV